VPKKQIFCSSKCFGSNNTLHNTSESNWKPKTKYFTQKCIYCGKEYNVWNYRKSQFCSQQCHFNYKHIKTKCLDCGKNIDKPIWVYNSGFTEKFCDDCRIKHSSKRSMFELTVYLNLLPLFNNINNKYVVSLINVKIYPDIVINDKFIIECMGDYWHCNPFYCDAGYLNKRMNKTASEIWKKDEKRKCILESLGYNVVNIWEKDWNENKEKCINKIRSIVNENDISKN
jgi:G:T-mismatch repair DNA endonuclease (very short patch repair protein)